MSAARPPLATRRGRRGSGGLTLTDVARLARVSPITVSRALNSPEQLTAETLARVQEAIARTGYVPNRVAGGLASSKSRLVAALVPTIASPVFLETIEALTETLGEAGYQLMLGQSGYGESREDALLDAIIGRRPDGVILTGVMHSPAGRRRLAAAGIPVVETWDLTPTPIDMLVGFSHEKAGAAVADYLHYRGARHPGMVSANDDRARLRLKGFSATAARHGWGTIPAELVPAPTTLGYGRAALARLLDQHPQTDAVFCSSDMMALGVLIEAQARGIRVPHDLRVFGFGDNNFAADVQPALSSVRIDGTAIGRQAARFVIDRVEGRPIPERIIDLGFKLIARASA
jgi:LacI family transcriptional regulator, gluconate utilization system Gnt-I transcriptional repressor